MAHRPCRAANGRVGHELREKDGGVCVCLACGKEVLEPCAFPSVPGCAALGEPCAVPGPAGFSQGLANRTGLDRRARKSRAKPGFYSVPTHGADGGTRTPTGFPATTSR